jgi:molybdopterin-guanine dinucleotide biosynthesis protein A
MTCQFPAAPPKFSRVPTVRTGDSAQATALRDAVKLGPEKILNPARLAAGGGIKAERPIMVLLAAGKGTRFGQEPKCAQLVNGVPLARHSIAAFQSFSSSPVICVVGYRHEQVAAALGGDNVYLLSENPAGGTAFAVYEAFSMAELERENPVVIVSMGDRIVPASVFRRLCQTHLGGVREADLTFLSAIYEPPRNRGKGRVIRDADRRVLGIVEQKDIDGIADEKVRQSLDGLTEGNCPLYAIRARTLRRHLEPLSNANAQRQYYLTDIIESLRRRGGEIRTITTTVAEPEYDLLCSDVTRPMDLALLEGVLKSSAGPGKPGVPGVEQAAALIRADRPSGQAVSIARQLEELVEAARKLGFKPDQPVAIGISGGRLRIAFMHPDMGRFFGPAWQMPTGACDATGREQIVVLMQASEDRRIHLTPTNPEFQEKICSIPADIDCMYPGTEVADWYTYEGFGTRMAENLLLSLGYFTDEEVRARRKRRQPLPPASLWVSASMRRPFSLVGNAIASMRTVRTGTLGAKVQSALGRETFRGLRIVSAGDIPRGGFSSSSAVTVATKNAINALFDLGVPPDMLVHLSCQAEYGTGVRAGSLDQATEQKGRAGQGTLISSNPKDNYRIIATYPVPAARFQVVFPYSVDRDRAAWSWSAGVYSDQSRPGRQTTGEMRKMTGKAAELAAILLRLPLEQDFFKLLEDDFVRDGTLGAANRRWVGEVLRKIPLLISQAELKERVEAHRSWHVDQLAEVEKLDPSAAAEKTNTTFDSLFAGWRDPRLRRRRANAEAVEETGVPLRAMAAYLFCEAAKNFHLIRHPDDWIQWVSRSQWGDRAFAIDPARLPDKAAMMSALDWEKGLSGPALMERWLERFGAEPFDFNRGLQDSDLAPDCCPPLHLFEGTNFFRGLALLDLAEAMLKRAFGSDAVAVRVNAAGQGDFFQVHVDSTQARIEAVKEFIRAAFYRRFGLSPEQEFVEPHPGGGAVGINLKRFDQLPDLVRALDRVSAGAGS